MKACVLDCRMHREVTEYLLQKHVRVIPTKAVATLERPLDTHTDIQLTKVGEQLICAPSLFPYYKQFFPAVLPGETEPRQPYPFDAAYNCLTVGKRLFHRLDSTDPVVLREATRQGYTLVPVRQGYAACSTLKVSERAVITADRGMAAAMSRHGIEVCLISEGGIRLFGFPCGFIGGAGGAFEDEILMFGECGDLKIREFVGKQGKRLVTFEMPAEDFGGMILI